MTTAVLQRRDIPTASVAPDFRDRARDLVPLIEAASSRIEAEGEIPADVMAALHDAQLFRMLLPRSVGGAELDLPTFVETVEILGGADASVAWCVSQAGGCATAAAYLPPKVAREVFAKPDAVLSWGPPASGEGKVTSARQTKDGYRVSGEWQFGSGCHNATWLGGAATQMFTEDGALVPSPQGRPPAPRMIIFPKQAATMIPLWDVVGLRGTGSDSYTVDDLAVPTEFCFEMDNAQGRFENGPLYLFPTLSIYGYAFAGVALGIARATIEAFVRLASDKTPAVLGSKLRENSTVQTDVAKAEAQLRAARMYMINTLQEVWEGVAATGKLTLEQRVALRLMVTYTIHQAKEVVDVIYGYAGTSAIFVGNPFERRFRDIHTMTQHLQARFSHYETVGQIVLGLPPKFFH